MADTKERARKQAGAADPAATPPGAEQAQQAPKGQKKDQKKEKKGKKGPEAPASSPEAQGPPPEPGPPPRLHEYYEQKVRAKLAQQFGLKNPHEVPKLVKIVLNVGMGDATKNPKGLDAAVAELAAITGPQPVVAPCKNGQAKSNLS